MMTIPSSQPQSNNRQITFRTNGQWFFNWSCGVCMDSGLVKSLLGYEQCTDCQAFLDPVSSRVFGAICARTLSNKPIDDPLFNMARALVAATSQYPMPGAALASLLLLQVDESGRREVSDIAKRLRDEWRLPVLGSRSKPRGYFIARNAEEFLEWGRVTRSQAVSELATYYKLFKSNFPELAGQQSLDFVNVVSNELQEAIR